MESTKSDLLGVLDNIAASLPSDARQYWSAYSDEARRLLLASDYSQLEKLLSANYGLGSLEVELKKASELFLGESWGDWQNAPGGSS